MAGRLVSGGRELPATRLAERATRAANAFKSLGVGESDAVALLLRNDFSFFEASRAASLLGAFSVPINWHFTGAEVAYIVKDSGAKLLVVHADLLAAVQAELPAELPVIVVETAPEIAAAYGVPAGATGVAADNTNWDSWIEQFPATPLPPKPAPSAVIYTSGTTGRPKGVRRNAPTAENMVGFGKIVARVCCPTPDARTIVSGPMYHAAPNAWGLTFAQVGAEIWLSPRFDAEGLLRAIDEYRLTHLFLVPTMFVRLLKLPEEARRKYDVSSLKFVSHASAPCPPDVKRRMIEWWGPVITEYYGSTETGSVTFCTSADWLAHPGTVGRALDDTVIKIFDENRKELTAGEVGEIYARNYNYTDFNYHRDPGKRAEVDIDGLITSGDLGYLDRDGFLFICDRRKDMIISGGVNIYPAEVESCLINLKGVKDCAVFGIPDDEYGESLAAVVQLEDGVSLTVEVVRDFLAGSLARYKLPKLIQFAKDLPREDSGKIKKRLLREPYWEKAGRRV